MTWVPCLDYTDPGRLLGHITLSVTTVQRFLDAQPGFPHALATELLHCILSHHGATEHGSPVAPMTLEALALHMADNLDAELNMFATYATQAPDPQHPGWTQYHRRLERRLYLPAVVSPKPPPPLPLPAESCA